MTGLTLLAVWKSAIDPWGFFLDGGSLVFYSSTIIFAGVLVGWSHQEEDTISLDAR